MPRIPLHSYQAGRAAHHLQNDGRLSEHRRDQMVSQDPHSDCIWFRKQFSAHSLLGSAEFLRICQLLPMIHDRVFQYHRSYNSTYLEGASLSVGIRSTGSF